MNDAIVHFVLGASPVVMLYPYLVLHSAHRNMSEEERQKTRISVDTLFFVLPIVYGLLFSMLYNCCGFIPRKMGDTYFRFIMCGALASLGTSLLLHYLFRIHTDWIKTTSPMACHAAVFVFYLIVYYTIGQWLRAQVLYGPTAGSSDGAPTSPSAYDSIMKSTTQPI